MVLKRKLDAVLFVMSDYDYKEIKMMSLKTLKIYEIKNK